MNAKYVVTGVRESVPVPATGTRGGRAASSSISFDSLQSAVEFMDGIPDDQFRRLDLHSDNGYGTMIPCFRDGQKVRAGSSTSGAIAVRSMGYSRIGSAN